MIATSVGLAHARPNLRIMHLRGHVSHDPDLGIDARVGENGELTRTFHICRQGKGRQVEGRGGIAWQLLYRGVSLQWPEASPVVRRLSHGE